MKRRSFLGSLTAQESDAPGESFVLYGFPEDSETAVEASITPPESGAIGFMVSATPGGEGNPKTVAGYLLRIAEGKATLLRRESGRKETELASASLPARSVRIRLETDGDSVTVIADRKELVRVADTTFSSGGAALYSENTRAEFVNPRVRAHLF